MTDLDFILTYSDILYKNINLPRVLSIEGLPRQFDIEGCTFNFAEIQSISGEMDFKKLSTFLPKFMTYREQTNGILFFANGQTITIFWNIKNIFLFDSHSRDQMGNQ